ncbi:hypothetical protein KO498_16530 [Lentibacter algarum]|nr:hypothetical protein [Lentibacter algarum]
MVDLTVKGDTLVFDTTTTEDSEIDKPDIAAFLSVLRANTNITTVQLNSSGGSVWSAEEISRIIVDFELDTVVNGRCSSSCVMLLLAGTNRSLTRGSKIGFHSRSWSASSMQRYYESEKESEGWDTPFEFGSWSYRDTYREAHELLSYLVDRGVDPVFAIETIALREEMWYPSRRELTEAGVLTN